jgi:hypothetical protein
MHGCNRPHCRTVEVDADKRHRASLQLPWRRQCGAPVRQLLWAGTGGGSDAEVAHACSTQHIGSPLPAPCLLGDRSDSASPRHRRRTAAATCVASHFRIARATRPQCGKPRRHAPNPVQHTSSGLRPTLPGILHERGAWRMRTVAVAVCCCSRRQDRSSRLRPRRSFHLPCCNALFTVHGEFGGLSTRWVGARFGVGETCSHQQRTNAHTATAGAFHRSARGSEGNRD